MEAEVKIRLLKKIAETDASYWKMKQDFKELEMKFDETVSGLTGTQQDIIWEFVFASNELDEKLMEIACDYMDFYRI